MPEEVVLLLNKQLAYLVDDCKAHLPATNAQRDHYVASREAAITEQKRVIASTASEKRKAMEAKYADKIASKRAERAAKKQAAQPQATPDQADPQAGLVQLSAPEPEKSSSTPTPPADSAEEDLSQVVYPVKIRGLSEGLPWYQPESYTYHSIDQARQAGVWTYPSNAVEEARCQVFEDLWQKGHFMGNGLRFGGSLLVYPDDPLRYHSHFSTTILKDNLTPVSPTDIVSSGRLATAVKKAHLLCAPVPDAKPDQERVQYFSLEWASMG